MAKFKICGEKKTLVTAMPGVKGSQPVTLSGPPSFNGKQQKVIGQARPTLLILSPIIHKWGWVGLLSW